MSRHARCDAISAEASHAIAVMRFGKLRCWLWAVILLMGLTPGFTLATAAREYQIKAVFLFNFTQFVVWPPEQFADEHTPLVIGILGSDPYGNYLDETVRGEKVGGRALVVERYRSVDDIVACQVLFISSSEARRFQDIIARLRGRPILTVTDAGGAGQAGGIVRFVTENNHVRLQIDVLAAKAAGLTISSKLLRAADIIGDGGE
jgi:hypothetical protein